MMTNFCDFRDFCVTPLRPLGPFRDFRDFCVTKLKTKISVCKFRYPHIGNRF